MREGSGKWLSTQLRPHNFDPAQLFTCAMLSGKASTTTSSLVGEETEAETGPLLTSSASYPVCIIFLLVLGSLICFTRVCRKFVPLCQVQWALARKRLRNSRNSGCLKRIPTPSQLLFFLFYLLHFPTSSSPSHVPLWWAQAQSPLHARRVHSRRETPSFSHSFDSRACLLQFLSLISFSISLASRKHLPGSVFASYVLSEKHFMLLDLLSFMI